MMNDDFADKKFLFVPDHAIIGIEETGSEVFQNMILVDSVSFAQVDQQ